MSDEQSENWTELCLALDDLTLRKIDLLDEQLMLMKNIEDVMASGFLNMAKSRYISGERSVTVLQVPGEESELQASTKVVSDSSGQMELIKVPNGVDPLKWFGILVPGSLRQSQQAFRKAIELVIDVVNTRKEFQRTLSEYNQKHNVKTL